MSLRCFFGNHACRTQFDKTGIWGECKRCHRRFGFTPQSVLDAITDRHIAHYKATGKMLP